MKVTKTMTDTIFSMLSVLPKGNIFVEKSGFKLKITDRVYLRINSAMSLRIYLDIDKYETYLPSENYEEFYKWYKVNKDKLSGIVSTRILEDVVLESEYYKSCGNTPLLDIKEWS